MRYAYWRKYKRGWSFKIDSNESFGAAGATGRKGLFDRVQIQKRSTCTTMNMGYSYNRQEYYINFFINAFPSYPVSTQAQRDKLTGEWDLSVTTPTEDIFNLQRGLQGGGVMYPG